MHDRCNVCGKVQSGPGASCSECAETTDARPDFDATITGGASSPTPSTGPKQIGSYRIIRELGAGGMGTVFEAHDERMDRRVALKVLSRHQAPSNKPALRFAQEAWIAGKLNHPSLVKVYERGEWEELSFYSMELVRGGSISDVVKNMKLHGRDDRLGLEFGASEYMNWVLRTVIDTARGLIYAHREGVVHRDIKPMNILLSRETGKVKIADFGLAIEQDATRMTTAGKMLGTLAYMSPEQILGKEDVDALTDVYALGVTLFEMLTLALPYTGKTQQLFLNAVLTSEVQAPRKLNARVGRDLDVVMRKALEKRREDRYSSMAELADDLENVLHFRPIHANPPSSIKRLAKWTRRKPLLAALIVVLAVAVPVIAVLGQRASERRELLSERQISEFVEDIRWLRQRGRNPELIDKTTRILALDSNHELALQLRAVSRLTLASADEGQSVAYGNAALSDIARLVELLPDETWPLRLREYALNELGRAEEADAVAAAIETVSSGSREDTYNDLFFDGLLLQDRGDHEGALQLFSRARAASPASAEPVRLHAWSLEALGKRQQAIQDYRLVIGLNPDDAISNFNLGRLLTEVGSADEGELYMLKAADLQPESPSVHQALAMNDLARGTAAVAAGDLESARTFFVGAEEHARESLRFGPGDPWSHLNLGVALMEWSRIANDTDPGRIEEAVEHYQTALQLLRERGGSETSEEFVAALINICDALIQTEQLERALIECAEVVERVPDDALGFYNLAGVYALLGRSSDAMDALERNFELGDRDWAYLETDAWFESLRQERRFDALLERMKADGG